MTTPRFASALSRHPNSAAAVDEVCRHCRQVLGSEPDLSVVFMSSQHAPLCGPIAQKIGERLGPRVLVGGTGESIVGTGEEVEFEPALALWAARLPNVELLPFHLQFVQTPEGGSIAGWPDELLESWPAGAALLLIGDPFSFPVDYLLERLNEDRPGVPIVGGMCSAAQQPGLNRLICDDRVLAEGAVALLIHGDVQVGTLVSQGCRPIGDPLVITKAEQNLIHELGGLPAYRQLERVFDQLPTRDQQLVQRGLQMGRVVNEYLQQFEQGDFLVRNVMGIEPDEGAIAIGDFMRPGQTVQFHVRDAETADAELRQLLAAARTQDSAAAAAGLIFTCNGRGVRMFGQPHHDAQVVRQVLGDIPLAGFFAAGEIGPVGGSNFLHGYTASLLLFYA